MFIASNTTSLPSTAVTANLSLLDLSTETIVSTQVMPIPSPLYAYTGGPYMISMTVDENNGCLWLNVNKAEGPTGYAVGIILPTLIKTCLPAD
jgi:hypothetical protein